MLKRAASQLTYANVMATIAVFIALGGTSYAVTTGSIDSREIQNNSIRSGDVLEGTVRSSDIRDHTILSRDVKKGVLKAEGLPGRAATRWGHRTGRTAGTGGQKRH